MRKSPELIVNPLFKVKRAIPIIEKPTPKTILFSSFSLNKPANNKGTKTTVRLNKNPAFEADVDFTPMVTTEIAENKMVPNKNPYFIVRKSTRTKRL